MGHLNTSHELVAFILGGVASDNIFFRNSEVLPVAFARERHGQPLRLASRRKRCAANELWHLGAKSSVKRSVRALPRVFWLPGNTDGIGQIVWEMDLSVRIEPSVSHSVREEEVKLSPHPKQRFQHRKRVSGIL